MSAPGSPILTARWHLAAAAGVALFTVYGSLVPFEAAARDLNEALAAFRYVLEHRVRVESRSDWLANCLLGVPLGYCLLGAACVDRPGVARPLVLGLALLPLCGLFAAGVEFLQLFFPGRTCSGSDVIAQTLGASLGLSLWVAGGPAATEALRRAWANPRAGGVAGRALVGTLGFVALVQLLPLDIHASPADAYRKLRSAWRDPAGAGQVNPVPFADVSAETAWAKTQSWLELAGLFLPAGLLVAQLPGPPRHAAWPAAALGFGLAAATECGQLVVSRHPSATDVVIGTAGLVAGWAAGRACSLCPRSGLNSDCRGGSAVWPATSGGGRVSAAHPEPELGALSRPRRWRATFCDRYGHATPALVPALAAAWLAVLAVAHWQPFALASPGTQSPVIWIPFSDSQGRNYLGALDQALQKLAMFVPLGVAAAALGAPSYGWRRPLVAAAFGLAVGAVLEAGQLLVAGREAATTDLVTSAAGALAGAIVAQQVRRLQLEGGAR